MKQFDAAFAGWVLKNGKKGLLLFLTLFGFTALFAQGPVISFTPLSNTCSQNTDQTLTVNIVDADGVPTSGGGLPHLYWRINAGLYTPVTGTSIGGGNYTFTFGAGISGQVISYYVVAQDNAGSVSVSPSAGAGGLSTSPPAAATPPTIPQQFVIQNTLAAGTYTIGVGGLRDFLTITDAVNAYNNSCLNGNVIFLLMDPNYNAALGEVFPITINNPQASNTRRLLIKPNGSVNSTIAGSSNDAIFRLNGADYVTIDGCNSFDPLIRTRNLTIRNDAVTPGAAVVWLASAGASNAATNNTIKSCKIVGSGGSTTFAGIVSCGSSNTGASAEAPNSNNTFENNDITKSYIGIALYGNSATDQQNLIKNNLVGSATVANMIGFRSIYAHNQTGLRIDSNDVKGVLSVYGSAVDVEPTAGIMLAGISVNANVFNNTIQNIKNTNVLGLPVMGIALMSETANTNTRIYNNFIFNIAGGGNASNPLHNAHAIGLISGGGVKVYHNSIHLSGNQTVAGTTSGLYTGLAITAASTVDVRNNIFSNRIGNGSRYGVYCATTNIIFSAINYNNYYAAGAVGFLGGPRVTIGAWQLATASDINSVSVNPLYISATNLHLQTISPMNSQGTNVGITSDIDLEMRSATTPDIGADEMTPPACSDNLGGTVTANVAQICNSGAPILFAAGFSSGAGIDYQWQSSTDNVSFTNLAGEKNPTTATPPSINVTTYYRLRVTCNSGPEGYSSVRTIPVNNPQVVSATNTATRCGVGTVSLTATGSAGTTLRWYDVPVNGEILGTGPNFTTPPIYANDSFYVETNIGGVNTTVGPASPTAHGGTVASNALTMWATYFDVLAPTKFLSVDIYPVQAGQTGNVVIYRPDSTVMISVPYTTTVSGGNTAQVIPINLAMPVGTGYYIWSTGYEDIPASGLTRNVNGSIYPYTSSEVHITGNEFQPGYYMYYYRWRFSSGCQNTPRRLVKVNLTTPPAVNTEASLPSVCANTPTVLTATSANPNYIYTWQPGNLVGATVTVSPGVPTSYVVLANDGTCAITDTVDISMKAQPQSVTATPVTSIRCESDAALAMNVTGGIVNGELLLIEGFNGATDPPAGWYKTSGTGAFSVKDDGYNNGHGYTFHTNDNSRFFYSNAYTGTVNQALRSPVLNTMGYTTLTLSFWHYLATFDFDSVVVQVSTTAPGTAISNTGWTTVATYKYSEGSNIAFQRRTIDLSAWAGQPELYIRWKYGAKDDFWYALDNVQLTGDDAPPLYSWTPTTGLYLDAAATTPYTGGDVATVYAKPLVTTDFIASSTAPNGCQSKDTNTVTVRVAGGVISGDNTICAGGTTNLSVALTGTGPWNFTYTDGTTPVTVSGVNVSPYIFPVTPSGNTVYTLTSVSDAFCAANPANVSGTATISLTSIGVSSWLGASTDWHDQDNWCGLVPDGTIDVIIPTGLPNYPVISAAAAAKNIQLSIGASLTIINTAVLEIAGNLVNDGTLTNNGTIELNGSAAQVFPGGTGTIAAMSVLDVNNSGPGVTINRKMRILQSFKPTNGDISLLDSLTISSTSAGTANVDRVGSDVTITYGPAGKFVVERYIPGHPKAWQLLSAPTVGQTVKQAWQENAAVPLQNLKPGYGTIMTGHQPSALVNGFDILTPLGSTITSYDAATNRWEGIPNTNITPVSSKNGFMILVRGDRSVTTHDAPATETTLRNTGRIYSPAEPPPSTTVLSGKFEAVGNPYASSIDFLSVLAGSSGIDAKFYVWDPSLSGGYGMGRYQTISSTNGYRPVPGSALYPNSTPFTRIQSGQAILVYSTGGGTVNFNENNKINGSDMQFRAPGVGNRQFMHAWVDVEGMAADGNVVAFDRTLAGGFDAADALKMSNNAQNFGIRNNGKLLALDGRSSIQDHDTVFYNLTGMGTGEFTFRFAPENMDPFTHAWLIDRYQNRIIPVSTSDTTKVEFTIISNAGSKAADRFYLVFKRKGRLPVMYTTVFAEPAGTAIAVSWKVEQERDVKNYVVERSADNIHWEGIASQNAGAGAETADYGKLDDQPFRGNNYYRIRTIAKGGEEVVSEPVLVVLNDVPTITVYPNPVTGPEFTLAADNLPRDKYQVIIVSEAGATVHAETIDIGNGKHTFPIRAGKMLPPGTYFLVINGSKYKKRLKLVVL